MPFHGLLSSSGHDVCAQRDDLSAFLGNGNEFFREIDPSVGWNQRAGLQPDQSTRANVKLRLIVQRGSLPAHRLATGSLNSTFVYRRAKVSGILHDLIPAVSLGGVHRAVGLLKKIRAVGSVIGKETYADAGADPDLMIFDGKSGCKNLQQSTPYLRRFLSGMKPREKDRELIAADAGERI